MLTGLLLTAFMMGLGGMAHCAAMCGVACAAAFPRGLPSATWLGRLLGYAILGAIAALGAGAVSRWGREVAMLKPLWIMAQVAVVMLGVYLMLQGRMPAALDGAGRSAYDGWRAHLGAWSERLPAPWRSVWRLAWPLLGGMAWALLPCGLLYAALMVAALAPHAWGGAAVMLAFAVPSSVGVWAAPWLLRQLRTSRFARPRPAADAWELAAPPVASQPAAAVPVIWMQQAAQDGRQGGAGAALGRPAAPSGSASGAAPAATPGGLATPTASPLLDPRWAVRLAGACMALLGAWAVWHQLVAQWQAWCA